jgi:VIT1/CCC1 family predicted Fe2+/Mn2+ transporter
LLNELLMCTTPDVTFLRSRLRLRGAGAFAIAYFLTAIFLLATVFFGPLRVRALVWVR